MLYPLFLEPIYKKKIWGGRNLEKLYGRKLPDGAIGESWEVSCHGNDISLVTNGELKGYTLSQIMNMYKKDFLGTNSGSCDNFPLLVKFIDAADNLSVQVHPGNEYAKKYENDMGKSEMWYIISAKSGAKLIYGLIEKTNKEEFKEAVYGGKTSKYLNYIDIKKGDVLYIPSGTVHAILEETLLLEVQQNSNVTYRLYDWDRVDSSGKPRELHIEKALDVINYDFEDKKIENMEMPYGGFNITNLVSGEFFNTDLIEVKNNYRDYADGKSLFIFTCIEGSGKILFLNINYPISAGVSFIVPASMGQFSISGNLKLIKSYI